MAVREENLGSIMGPQGPQGPKGATGATGPQGIKGDKGDAGATWISGTAVPTTQGVNGDYYINTTNWDVYKKTSGAWAKTGNIKGATGAQGVKGDTGPTGPTGPKGATGAAGPQGAAGITPKFEIRDGNLYAVYNE